MALGIIGIRALLALNTVNLPRIGDHGSAVTADWRVLSFTVLVSLAASILFGLIPALQASRAGLSEALNENRGCSGTNRRHTKTRSVLVSSEVSLALVLVVGAGLLIRSYIAVRFVNPGFESRKCAQVCDGPTTLATEPEILRLPPNHFRNANFHDSSHIKCDAALR